MTGAVMIQGTGSNVGKSLIVAGLARAFTNRGLRVCPFKSQNMSNNAAVTAEGGEIGRAQALQARACKIRPTVHMNPVLLKPETNTGAQIILRGKRQTSMEAREYLEFRKQLLEQVIQCYVKVSEQADLILVEGAGSPAEINLREGDIANMGFAQAVGLPVILAGDIHRGGVIASLIGTLEVLSGQDQKIVKGFLINNFHGDPSIFNDGLAYIENRTELACFGIIPHFPRASFLPSEDILDIDTAASRPDSSDHSDTVLKICVPRLKRIANFDDLDPLIHEENVRLSLVQPGQPIPGDADLILIPGTKSTISDLEFIRTQGWDIDVIAHVRQGKPVMGLCGGYQILGKTISDPVSVEGTSGKFNGLGLLDVHTVLSTDKKTSEVQAVHCGSRTPINGYQIHLGVSQGPDRSRPFAQISGEDEGAMSEDGLVTGTYIHGCFAGDSFRRSFLSQLKQISLNPLSYENSTDQILDELAEHMEEFCNLDAILETANIASSLKLVSSH